MKQSKLSEINPDFNPNNYSGFIVALDTIRTMNFFDGDTAIERTSNRTEYSKYDTATFMMCNMVDFTETLLNEMENQKNPVTTMYGAEIKLIGYYIDENQDLIETESCVYNADYQED